MNDPLIWCVLCFVLAVVLLLLDIFVPSGGLLTAFSLVFVIAAVVFLWQVSAAAAVTAIFLLAALIPLALWQLVKHFDHLPFTRRLILQTSQQAVVGSDQDNDGALVGETGKALTDLRPVGSCLIDNQRMECLAESGVIDRGAAIAVVSHKGLEIKVRKAPA